MRPIHQAVAAAVLSAALTTTAIAQQQAAENPRDDLDTFLKCRSYALLHLGAADWRNALVGEATTNALLDQMSFVMMESTFGDFNRDLEDVRRRALFAERYYRVQSRDVVERGASITTRDRDAALLDCLPKVWNAVQFQISHLMRWREKAVDAPEREWVPPPLRRDDRRQELTE